MVPLGFVLTMSSIGLLVGAALVFDGIRRLAGPNVAKTQKAGSISFDFGLGSLSLGLPKYLSHQAARRSVSRTPSSPARL
jgi:hypothetical protein